MNISTNNATALCANKLFYRYISFQKDGQLLM